MNYNFPYYGMMPLSRTASLPIQNASGGFFSKLLKGFNWGSLLNNTQKTLSIVNQTIPLIKQANPIVKNAKTMFRVMSEFKKMDFSKTATQVDKGTKTTINKENKTFKNTKEKVNNQDNTGGPVFFV